jgi:serine-type D-Ala-D-Ala endopeptidase (penicillin-binding protein 7)
MLRSISRGSLPGQPGRLNRALTLTCFAGILVLTLAGCASPNRNAPEIQPQGSQAIQHDQTARTSLDLRSDDSSELDTWTRSNDWPRLDPSSLRIQAASALVVDEHGNRLYAKNARAVRPIASVSKLMTAMVVLDAGVPMSTPIKIIEQDKDRLRNSRSRLRCGEARLTRGELMMAALISSDNRAAHALARTTYRGGTPAFINAMNRKAQSLGMRDTFFADASGLNSLNRSTADDLAKMVRAAGKYSFIRKTTSRGETTLRPFNNGTALLYRNTNPLVRDPDWKVEVSKTGYINEAGHCLVMQTQIADRRVYMVFLDAAGRSTNVGDSNRVRNWILSGQQTAAR